jgi:hypothetical protein
MMPSARVALGAHWMVSRTAFVGLAPSFTYSKTSGDALSKNVSALYKLEIAGLVGVGL